MTATQRQNIIDRHVENGVIIPCADGIIIGEDVTIGAGTLVYPGTILPGQVTIGQDCIVGPNSILHNCTVGDRVTLNNVQAEDSEIGDNCKIGPWVRLRPGTKIGAGVRIGNFVELKNAQLGEGTKVAHLSYIGDATLGQNVNVGCGLAVANYDGKSKHYSTIDDDAFIGCNNIIVSPVHVGKNAYTAAGSVITEDVPAGKLAIARARQVNKERKQ